jgi:hypothetical protein
MTSSFVLIVAALKSTISKTTELTNAGIADRNSVLKLVQSLKIATFL